MLRTAITALCLVGLCTGCPERDRLVDHVGGGPGRQVDDARVRASAAEVKLQHRADDAEAVKAE